jgi:hypothetical protein
MKRSAYLIAVLMLVLLQILVGLPRGAFGVVAMSERPVRRF